MKKTILPIGTVVLLKDSTKRVMIMGLFQRTKDNPEKLWDYAGCFFPEGYVGKDTVFVFNHDQIEKIYMIGYQDVEQFRFHDKLNTILNENK